MDAALNASKQTFFADEWIMRVVLIVALIAALLVGCTASRPIDGVALAGTCIATLKQIQQAKAVWALENSKTDKDVPAQSELFGPQGYIQKMPLCPQGGIYTIGSVGEPPRCSVTSHTLQR